ncbi:hypothetical protein BDN72DRAFT_321754 [Pluteus cervinus]|uniref:Uncharacterized protein n=2 Tax=Pluteus cervinus TaxID=181527 RepID=A0ACD3ADG0_9AGAR|nr:hypothetical protein BDN72DRAFT_329941 [Pluteus cervinus]TFK63434.1 hypothetical protein BDN72DRAFT_321754 [Pluteus cervinus]
MRFFSVVLVLASTVATLALPAPAEVTNIGKILTDISAISGVVSALDLDIGLINTKPSDAQVTAIAQAGIELPSKLAQLTNDIKRARSLMQTHKKLSVSSRRSVAQSRQDLDTWSTRSHISFNYLVYLLGLPLVFTLWKVPVVQ